MLSFLAVRVDHEGDLRMIYHRTLFGLAEALGCLGPATILTVSEIQLRRLGWNGVKVVATGPNATKRSARLRQLRIKQVHTPNKAPSGCLMLLPL